MEIEDKECSLGTDLSLTINSQSAIRNSNIAISVRKLSKKYQLYETPKHRLKEALHPFKKKYHHDFWAVRNVSFEARHGETVGIIGRNGSGKSTLLQMICGTLTPTQGDINVNGRVSALLELGAGFNPQYTGKENVYMNAAIMGLSKEEINARYDNIVAFADIDNFIYQPVKTYSSGMYVRLAFACAINMDPEILIIDEALAVGDAKFQRKCYAKLELFRKGGKTILFVSHNEAIINQICDRAMLLDKGQIVEQGEPKHITKLYYKMLFGEDVEPDQKSTAKQKEKAKSKPQKDKQRQLAEKEELERKKVKELAIQKLKDAKTLGHSGEMRYGNKKAEIIDFGILDQNGEKTSVLETLEKYTIFSRILFHEDLDDIILGYRIRNVNGVLLFAINNYHQNIVIPPQKREDILEGRVLVTVWLTPGDYFLTFNVWKEGPIIYDLREDVLHFKVIGDCEIRPDSLVSLDANIFVKKISD